MLLLIFVLVVGISLGYFVFYFLNHKAEVCYDISLIKGELVSISLKLDKLITGKSNQPPLSPPIPPISKL